MVTIEPAREARCDGPARNISGDGPRRKSGKWPRHPGGEVQDRPLL